MTSSRLGLAKIDVARLSGFATQVTPPAFKGAWATVEIQPDIFVPQRFSVGVVVQSPGNRLHFKLLDDVKKFECIYQDSFSQQSAKDILSHAEAALRKAISVKAKLTDIEFETNCLALSPCQYSSGEDEELTVERLFSELVVMAPFKQMRERGFETIDTARARALVNIELKRIAAMDFSKIVPNEGQGLLLDYNKNKHFLDLNLLPPNSCGSVTSAVYKSAQAVELNLLKTSRDLTTYSRVRDVKQIGLFLLTPDADQLSRKEMEKVEAVIGEHEWKLERDGFRVVSLPSAADLASEIYAWAKPVLG